MNDSRPDSLSRSLNGSLSDSPQEQGAGSRECEQQAGINTSSLTDAQTRGRAVEKDDNARIREIHPLDALTVAIGTIRPDWRLADIRQALANTGGSWHDLAHRALTVATDPTTRTPWRITNADLRAYEPTPIPPTLTEYRLAPRCSHGAEAGRCALCRTHHRTEEVPA